MSNSLIIIILVSVLLGIPLVALLIVSLIIRHNIQVAKKEMMGHYKNCPYYIDKDL